VAENSEELETTVATQEVIDAADKVLGDISGRSFAGRHPELGKMINCAVCQLRHRDSLKCEQKFVELYVEKDLETGEKKVIYAKAQQEPGLELPHQVSVHQPTIKQIVGAKQFAKKRRHPHPSKRNLRFIELVRSLTPNEYDAEDLKKAQTRARRILANKMGRHGFLPSVWKNTKLEAQVAEQA
jgi:hypothetical protein